MSYRLFCSQVAVQWEIPILTRSRVGRGVVDDRAFERPGTQGKREQHGPCRKDESVVFGYQCREEWEAVGGPVVEDWGVKEIVSFNNVSPQILVHIMPLVHQGGAPEPLERLTHTPISPSVLLEIGTASG